MVLLRARASRSRRCNRAIRPCGAATWDRPVRSTTRLKLPLAPSAWRGSCGELGTHDRHEGDARSGLPPEVVGEPKTGIVDLTLTGLVAELLPALEEHAQAAGADRVPETLEAAVRVDR